MSKTNEKTNKHKWTGILSLAIMLFVVCGCMTQKEDGSAALARKSENQESPIPHSDLSVYGGGAYAARSRDLFTKVTYLETGTTRMGAFQAALAECEGFADDRSGCVVIRTYNTTLGPIVTGDQAREWDCFAREAPRGIEDLAEVRT